MDMDIMPAGDLSDHVSYFHKTDRTFNCKKDHALPVLRHILEHDNGITNFHFEIAADLLDEEYFAVLKQLRPGAVQLEIGIQSTCPETIAAIDRKMDFVKVADVVIVDFQHLFHLFQAADILVGKPLR